MELLNFDEYYRLNEVNTARNWKDSEKEEFLNLQYENLIEALDSLKKHNVKAFIDCGTLLGIYRDKKLIPGDSDSDCGILAEDMKPDYVDDFAENLTSNGSMFFKPAEFISLHEDSGEGKYVNPKGFKYQMKKKGRFQTFKGKPIMTDLFLYYPYKKDRIYQYVSDYFRTKNDYVSGPCKRKTCNGYSFPMPCNPEGHLETAYGKNWKTPDPKWAGDYKNVDVYGGPLKTKDMGGRYKYNFKTKDYVIK
jgi:hypothetical protein